MHPFQIRALLSPGVALTLLVTGGCGSPTVIPRPMIPNASFCEAIGSGTMCFYRWDDKLSVMICTDMQGTIRTTVGFSGIASGHNAGGLVYVHAGRQLDWLLQEKEGQKVACRINDKEFDLDQGNLILVKTEGGEFEIQQISQDLSTVTPDIEGLKAFARKDPAVNKLIKLGDE
jgi:hypothetical protein